MNDFSTQLSAMLDDVAAGIDPKPNFDAVVAAPVPVASNAVAGGGRFPRFLGVAAVSVALLGGGVAAFQLAAGEPDTISTSSQVTPEPAVHMPAQPGAPADGPDVPAIIAPQFDDVATDRDRTRPITDPTDEYERTAQLGRLDIDDNKLDIDDNKMVQKMFGLAEPGEVVTASSEYGLAVAAAGEDATWMLRLTLTNAPDGTEVPILVTFGRSADVLELVVEPPAKPNTTGPETTEPNTTEPKPNTTEPKPETTEPKPPKPVEPKPETTEPKPEPPPVTGFVVQLGDTYNDETRLKQVFYGSAPAGSVITASSKWGSAEATAGSQGGWEMWLKMYDVPDGTVVHVTVSANSGGPIFEYDLVRDKPEPEPEPVAFTVNLGTGYLDGTPMKQYFHGTATPGSVVVASSDFGSADAVADSKGNWEIRLKMFEVPGGATVGVRVTNNASEGVFEFSLARPAPEPEPEPIDFTAQAAFVECDSTPPYNEYWGTSTAGAKITISSGFGGKQVMSNADGHWEARVEFPEAPLDQTFVVTIVSSQGGAVYSLPFKRIGPA